MFCLFGPTASGKTDHLLKLFDSTTAEVISADSMQVYRGLDIGTAKPSSSERTRLTHHLIDAVSPDTPWHVGGFVRAADQLIDRILAAGRLPVVSGGTAFYIRGLLCGLPDAPASSVQVRDRIQLRLKEEGAEELYRELRRVDPESAARISPSDEYRIARALEIFSQTGMPRSAYAIPENIRTDLDPIVVAIDRPRDELYARIDQRVAEMMARGLIEEIQGLVAAGFSLEDPGMRAIGYREVLSHPRVVAEGVAAAGDPTVAAEIERLIARNSRRYAKRQLTFFRRLPGVRWIAAEDHVPLMELAQDAIERMHSYCSYCATLDSNVGFE